MSGHQSTADMVNNELDHFQEMMNPAIDMLMADMNPNLDFSGAPDIHGTLENITRNQLLLILFVVETLQFNINSLLFTISVRMLITVVISLFHIKASCYQYKHSNSEKKDKIVLQ